MDGERNERGIVGEIRGGESREVELQDAVGEEIEQAAVADNDANEAGNRNRLIFRCCLCCIR